MFSDLFNLEQRTVTTFNSSDLGAPQLTADPGSLKTVLEAVLVAGYGDKTGLGWAMPFESADGFTGVFRSNDPTSDQFYFKVDDSGITNALLSSYQTMSDIDTGTSPIIEGREYKKVASGWKIIGHEKLFLLLLNYDHNGQTHAFPMWFGDMPRQTVRTEPLTSTWNFKYGSTVSGGGIQNLIENTAGSNSTSSASAGAQSSYSIKISAGVSDPVYIDNMMCKFGVLSDSLASALSDYIIFPTGDSSWSFLPFLLPLSATADDVPNLGPFTNNSIKAVTGRIRDDRYTKNLSCEVPTDWWYA